MGFSENLRKQGFYQKGLFDIINSLVTNFNGVLTKLDADGTVNDTNYNALLAISTPTIGSTFWKNVQPNGMILGDVVKLLKQLRTNFNALIDKLAADSGVNGTTVYTNQKLSNSQYLVEVPNAKVKILGADQGAIVDFLDIFISSYEAVL